MVDVGSLLELSVAFNFAYAFIRGLSDYEATLKDGRAHEYKRLGEESLKDHAHDLAELQACFAHFRLSLVQGKDDLREIFKWAVMFNGVCGLAAIMLLFNEAFNWLEFGRGWLLGFCLLLIFAPFVAAVSLWIISVWTFRDADKHLKEMKEMVIPS